MKESNITLSDLLRTLVPSKDLVNHVPTTMLNTFNKSFPEKYRYFSVYPGTLFVDIYKENDPYKLLERKVESMAILPASISIDNLDPNRLVLVPGDGLGYKVNKDDEMYTRDSPCLHIVLKPEDDKL